MLPRVPGAVERALAAAEAAQGRTNAFLALAPERALAAAASGATDAPLDPRRPALGARRRCGTRAPVQGPRNGAESLRTISLTSLVTRYGRVMSRTNAHTPAWACMGVA